MMNLKEWYLKVCDAVCNAAAATFNRDYIGFRLFDAITGENLTDNLDYDDWGAAKVEAVEASKDHDYIAVYIGF